MKTRSILIFLTFLLALPIVAQTQDSLTIYYNKYPQEAIKEGDILYRQAIRQQNTPLLLRAIILKNQFALEIDQDRLSSILRELNDYAGREKNIAAKSVLQSYIAELYQNYYNNNRYKIRERSELTGHSPENIEEWSSNIFKEKITNLYMSSITSQLILQQTPVSSYDTILIQGKDSRTLRPTLYDFLCHRAINNLMSLGYKHNYIAIPRQENFSGILSPLDEFISRPIPLAIQRPSTYILNIFRDLLAFRQKAGNPEALLLADLDRLEYAHTISRGRLQDSLYGNTLQYMAKEYASFPMVVEIWYRQAQLLLQLSYETPNVKIPLAHPAATEELKQKALNICESGIRQYPDYGRINLLNQVIRDIKRPQLNAQFKRVIYPGNDMTVNINSKNVPEILIEVYRVSAETAEYIKKQKKDFPRTLIFRQSIRLANKLVDSDTSFRFPVEKTGLYEFTISTSDTTHSTSGYFICSQLFTTQQVLNNQYRFLVRDQMSGQPVKGAKVLIYDSPRPQSQEIIDSVFTNKEGIAIVPHQGRFYQVTDRRNPNGMVCTIQNSYFRYKNIDTPLVIITDRKIYRPGQTVYFKGITWQATYDTIFALNRRYINLSFRDANNKEIKQQNFITGRFGSFSGSFVIPPHTMNGTFWITGPDGWTSITVSNYKRPEFEISFTKPNRIFNSGDSIRLRGLVSSFSGAKVSHTKVNYEITRNYIYPFQTNDQEIEQGITTTGINGEFEISLKAEAPSSSSGLRGFYYYQVKALVTDAKGETQEGEISVPVFSGKYSPAIEIPKYVNKNESVPFRISLENFEPGSVPREAEYSIALLKLPAQPLVDNEIQDTIIGQTILEGKLQLGQTDSLTPDLTQYKPGAYLFTVNCEGTISKSVFYLYSPKDKRPPIPTYNWLVEEKTQCRVGESARIWFGTSLRNAYVTYEVYANNQLIKSVSTTLSDGIIPITIPYEASFGNEAWLVVHYVRNGNYITNTVPIRRLYENRQLVLETKVFRDKLIPGEKETWEIHISNGTSRKVDAEMLAMMYDASLDKLQNYNIELHPSYVNRPFINGWDNSYPTSIPNYLYVPFRENKWIETKPFSFDQLNVFSNPYTEVFAYGSATDYQSGSLSEEKVTSAPQANNDIRRKASVKAAGAAQSLNDTKVVLRQNFEETAFFYPSLYPDSAGNTAVRFTIPESVTRWKFTALAHTPDMACGELTRYVTTSRPLMVRPNIPRFLRSGDWTEIKVVVSNLSDSTLHGQIDFEIFIPSSEQALIRQSAEFKVNAQENCSQTFKFVVPQDIDLAGCRIIARSNRFSDGEQQLIPILPDETLVTQTKNIYTTAPGANSFTLSPGTTTRKDYRLTLEIASNPIWYAVLAMPSLIEPQQDNATDIACAYYVNAICSMIASSNPEIKKVIQQWIAQKNSTTLLSQLNQNEELKSILLSVSPWTAQAQSETEQMQSLASLFNQDRLSYLQQQALGKLSALQTDDGAWCWFKGMYPSRFMTCNVLAIMARANTTGQHEYNNEEKMMQIKGLRYLDNEINRDFKNKQKQINRDQLLYLYVRSMYRDIPLGDALDAHKYYMELAGKQWAGLSLYEKAITAVTMLNYGKKEICQSILRSLRQYAVNTPGQGMFWPNNRNDSYRNSAVQVHTAMMEAFSQAGANKADIDLMKQWLLLQKQTQSWAGVPATVDAIYALLLTGTNQLAIQDIPQIRIGSEELKPTPGTYPLGYIKKSYPAAEIRPDMLSVNITKNTNTPTWGGLYLQYFEKYDRMKKVQDGLGVDKKLFLEINQPDGSKSIQPIAHDELKTGDKIIVRIALSLSRDMDFLHLKDLHAACLEPVEQLSRNYWKNGIAYYQEVKDACTNFFFNSLSKGTHIIEYPMWVNQSGEYQDGIATLQCIYAPAFNACSEATKIRVK